MIFGTNVEKKKKSFYFDVPFYTNSAKRSKTLQYSALIDKEQTMNGKNGCDNIKKRQILLDNLERNSYNRFRWGFWHIQDRSTTGAQPVSIIL